jgi:hypothetical protein
MEFKIGEGLIGWIAEHGAPLCLAERRGRSAVRAAPGHGADGRVRRRAAARSGAQVVGVLSALDGTVPLRRARSAAA